MLVAARPVSRERPHESDRSRKRQTATQMTRAKTSDRAGQDRHPTTLRTREKPGGELSAESNPGRPEQAARISDQSTSGNSVMNSSSSGGLTGSAALAGVGLAVTGAAAGVTTGFGGTATGAGADATGTGLGC